MDLGVPLGHPKGSQASSRVEPCKSALLSSSKSRIRLPVGLSIGIHGFLSRRIKAVTPAIVFSVGHLGDHHVSAQESGVSGVHWDIGGLLKW